MRTHVCVPVCLRMLAWHAMHTHACVPLHVLAFCAPGSSQGEHPSEDAFQAITVLRFSFIVPFLLSIACTAHVRKGTNASARDAESCARVHAHARVPGCVHTCVYLDLHGPEHCLNHDSPSLLNNRGLNSRLPCCGGRRYILLSDVRAIAIASRRVSCFLVKRCRGERMHSKEGWEECRSDQLRDGHRGKAHGLNPRQTPSC